MQSYLRLLKFVKPYRFVVGLAFLFSLLYALFNAVAIWFSASFITSIFAPQSTPFSPLSGPAANLNESLKSLGWQIIGGGDRFDMVSRVAVIFFLTYLLRNLFDLAQYYIIAFLEQRVMKDIRDRIYTHLLSQSLGFFQQRKTGELASLVLNDVTALNNHMIKVIAVAMRDPFVILVFLALLFTISLKLSLAALLLIPLAGILIDQLGKSLKRKSTRVQEALSGVTHLLQERLGGIRLIKITGSEATEGARFKAATDKHFRMALRQRRLDILNMPLTEILGLGIISLILVYGGYQVFRTHVIDAEDFVRFIALLFSTLNPAKSLGTAYSSMQVAGASSDRIFKLLDADERLPEPSKPSAISRFEQSIRCENVSFCYAGVQTHALAQVDLEIPRAQTLAIVGPSGAGKTTLIGLILRLFDPTSGRVLLDGIDLKDIPSADLRRLFGVVTQDVVLFNETIAANIAYGHDGVPKDKIQRAARLAYAEDFILAQSQGYNTTIGDRGVRLSGGQQQRLSIARALVHDPPIIIFDEATSQLDSESEGLIQQALESLRKDRTLIIIAHRIATIRRADRIVVLENGRILDQGSYDELLQRCELFNRLCQQQFLTVS